MISIVVLGFGNVGKHLSLALEQSDAAILKQVYNRSEITLPSQLDHIELIDDLNDLAEADICIIALPDDVIQDFSGKLPEQDRLVVHTSGSAPIDALKDHSRRAVFYPLQTFSAEREVNFRSVPICIEANNAQDETLLFMLAESISEKVTVINSAARRKLHLAAVFVNNFTNHFYHIADELVRENDLDFDLLKPLILETANKINTLSPAEAQTGPARRGDKNTIENHLHLLSEGPYRELYEKLTASILETYGKKL